MVKCFLTPAEATLAVAEGGKRILAQPLSRTVVLSLLAGFYIAFGAQLATMATFEAASHVGIGVTRFLGGSVFSLGLILVVLCGAELFTGNILLVKSALHGSVTWGAILRSWLIVLAGNLAGSLIFVAIMHAADLATIYGPHAVAIAAAKVKLSFTAAFARGVLCNWLVCLAVLMATAARDVTGKILACYFPIMAFVASGFEHSIANMYYIPYGILVNASSSSPVPGLDWTGFLSNIVPVTLGNAAGGIVFVACTYWFVHLKGESVSP